MKRLKKILGYQQINANTKRKFYHVIYKVEEWQNNYISTLEYLMWLNIYSGRSFNDLTQYPVFPWIITNYSSDKINLETDIRDFSIPMGMMSLTNEGLERKKCYIEHYNNNSFN